MRARRNWIGQTPFAIAFCVAALALAGCTGASAGLAVQSVSPNALAAGQTALLLVTGSGFQRGDVVRVGSTVLSGTVWISDQTLSAHLPAGLDAGNYDVVVVHPDGQEAAMTHALQIAGAPAAQATRPAPTRTVVSKTPLPTATRRPTAVPTPAPTNPPPAATQTAAPTHTPSPSPTPQQSGASPTVQTDALFAAQSGAVKEFYQDLGNRNFTAAYALLSPSYQASHPFPAWKAGYATTDGFTVYIYSTSTANTLLVQMVVTDFTASGGTVTRSYSGTWLLVQDPGTKRWLLDQENIHLG